MSLEHSEPRGWLAKLFWALDSHCLSSQPLCCVLPSATGVVDLSCLALEAQGKNRSGLQLLGSWPNGNIFSSPLPPEAEREVL